MSGMPPAKRTDGRPYDGNKQFLGNGRMRSCIRCHQHKADSPGQFKKWRGFLTCKECRDE